MLRFWRTGRKETGFWYQLAHSTESSQSLECQFVYQYYPAIYNIMLLIHYWTCSGRFMLGQARKPEDLMSGGWQRNATTSFIQTYERLERYWYERLVCLVRRTSSQISPPLTRTTACLFLATCLLITRTLCLCTVFVDFDLTFNYGSSTCMRIRLKFLWQMEKHSPPLTVVLAAWNLYTII